MASATQGEVGYSGRDPFPHRLLEFQIIPVQGEATSERQLFVVRLRFVLPQPKRRWRASTANFISPFRGS